MDKKLEEKIVEQDKYIRYLIDLVNDLKGYRYDGNEIYEIYPTFKNIEIKYSVDNFLNEIDEICKKYDISISHEDTMGEFILERYDPENIKWLKESNREALYE